MGLFLSTAIFQNCTEDAARIAVKKAEKEAGYNLIADKCQYQERNNGVQVLFNNYCAGYEELAKELSEEVKGAVMLLYIYDDDYWGYYFYENGQELDSFNPMPNYFVAVSAEEEQRLSGTSAVIAQYFNIIEYEIKKYLVPWTDKHMTDYEERAYLDDEFGQCNCWQMVDFMKKLGYSYDNFEFKEDDSTQELHVHSVDRILSEAPALRTLLDFKQYGKVFYTTGWLPNALDSEYVCSIVQNDPREFVKTLCLKSPYMALFHLQDSIDIERSDSNLFILSAFCNLWEGRSRRDCLKKAFGNLCNAINSDPDNIMLLRARSLILAFEFNRRVYIKDLTKLLELDPDNADVYLLSRAFFNYLESKINAAEKDLEKLYDYGVPNENDPRINYDAFSDDFLIFFNDFCWFKRFGDTRKKSWMLELVDGKKDDNISPVSWNMIHNGLLSLRQPKGIRDESFLILMKNPGKPYEQFLQTALPDFYSDYPLVYVVQTSVNENGTVIIYEAKISDLGGVIALFKNYFRSGTLDLSLFRPFPLYSPKQEEPISSTKLNPGTSSKKAKKQKPKENKLKGKFLNIVYIILAIFFVNFFSDLNLREPISGVGFREILEEKGYEVIDLTDQYVEYDNILKVLETDSDKLHIEFCEVDDKQVAVSLYENSVANIRADNIRTSSSEGTTYNQRHYLSNAETFYAVACYENTFLFAYTDKSNKLERNMIKKIVKKFQPPNTLIVVISLGVGGLCIFLFIGFIWMMKRENGFFS